MFRPVRKRKNELPLEAAHALLRTERRGVLAMYGTEGYPYAVPVNFYYDEGADKIYFHGARAGHKVDSLRQCGRVCFTVYGNETAGDPVWAPLMQSAVVFGSCRLIEGFDEALPHLRDFAMKYYPDAESVEAELAADGKGAQLFEISIEHITAKQVQEK